VLSSKTLKERMVYRAKKKTKKKKNRLPTAMQAARDERRERHQKGLKKEANRKGPHWNQSRSSGDTRAKVEKKSLGEK